MNSKLTRLFKDTAIFAVGSLGSKAILFFLVPLYTNVLSAAEYGTADLVYVFATLLIPITSLSIETAVIRFGMKADVKREQTLLCAFFVWLCASAAAVCIMPIFGLYKTLSEWRAYLAALIILSVAADIERAYLKVKDLNKAFSIIGICQTAVLALTNLLLLTVFRTGVKGYLLSNILSLLFCALVSFFVGDVGRDLRNARIDWKLLGRMLRYSTPMAFGGISWWILHSSDKIMIEWMVGASALGLYTAATKIPSMINVINSVFNQAWGLSSIREMEAGESHDFFAYVFDRFSLVLFGVGLSLIAFSKPIMGVYVGQDFRASWVYTPFLLYAAVYYALFSFMGFLYAALERTINNMWQSIMCAALNIVINNIAIRRFGAGGAVAGTAASYFLICVVSFCDVQRYVRFGIDIRRYAIHSILLFVAAFAETFTDCHVLISLICLACFTGVNRREIRTFGAYVKARLRVIQHHTDGGEENHGGRERLN